jgi:hypothetical protein
MELAMPKRDEYRGIAFVIGATIDSNGAWVGEFVTFKRSPDGTLSKDLPYKRAPGEFASEGGARGAARDDAKRFIDELLARSTDAE